MVRKIRESLALIIIIPISLLYVLVFVIIGMAVSLPSMLKAIVRKIRQ